MTDRLAEAKPGDRITLAAKEWKNAQITVSAKGKKGKPIIIQAAKRGKTTMTGNSKLVINGTYIIVDGVTWTDGQPSGTVVQFTGKSSHCRLTNSTIDVKGKSNTYVQIDNDAVGHRVDHCDLINKASTGTLMRIAVRPKGGIRHRVDHCRIGPFDFIDANGNEVIRLIAGNLKNSDPKRGMERAECVIEHNLFDRASGEGKEVVSLKSSANVIRYNTFVACFGGPKARRGVDNRFEYNWFFGDNTKRPKGIYQTGIQILGSGHEIRGNYFEDMARGSDTVRIAAIVAEEGQGKPPKDKGWRAPVTDLTIKGNVLVNCDQNICFGSQYTKPGLKSDTPPKDVTVSDTRIMGKSEPLRFKKQAKGVTVKNVFIDSNKTEGFKGIKQVKDAGLKKRKLNGRDVYWADTLKGEPLKKKDVGPFSKRGRGDEGEIMPIDAPYWQDIYGK